MGSRGEFDFIERIKEIFGNIGDRTIEGIGDDCATIHVDGNSSIVITTDLLTEGVHFLRSAISPSELGRKSLAVNLSDIAAMGAVPVASLISIALPAECNGDWADSFLEGYRELSAEHNVALIGGDTTSSLSAVTVNIVAIGRVANANIKRRSTARVGDRIFVAGTLGESAAGLKELLAGGVGTKLIRIHHNPTPQVAEGVWFGSRPDVHSMIDISDGLASDLMHILELSGVEAKVDLEHIPTSVDIELAVTGGEDYKLLLTASAESTASLKHDFEVEFGSQLYEIGEITAQTTTKPTIVWHENGMAVETKWRGYTHF